MTLQKKTLQRYRQLFPDDTLKTISTRTGIQITRVFRLFSGKTMKVAELEAFEAIINDKLKENPSFSRLQQALEEASALMTNEELAKLADYFERRITIRTLGRSYVRSNFQEANIA